MPGSLRGLTGTDVFPLSLSRAFAETQTSLMRGNEYHDGSSQRLSLVTGVRHSWKLAKRLTPSDLATLRIFWDAHQTAAFLFYNPKETVPANNYDETGAATAGRYLVRFNSDWSQSVGLALSDIPVDLIEVGSAADAFVDTESTGVWLARPRAGAGQGGAYEIYGEAEITNPPGGEAWLTTSSGPRVDFPGIILSDLEAPPGGYDVNRIEWPEARATFSHLLSLTIGSAFSLGFGPLSPPAPTSLWGIDFAAYDHETVAEDEWGFRDNGTNAIPSALMDYVFLAGIVASLYQPPDAEHPAKVKLHDSALALYFNAIRINCGGGDVAAAAGTGLVNHAGTYTYGADRKFSGGSSGARGGSGLYATERNGASFTYTFARNLFADYQPTCKYRVKLVFKEQQFSSAGQRVFSVSINGSDVITDLDLYADHTTSVYAPAFEVTQDSNQKLVIRFTASVGQAICNAIAVEPMVVE